MHIKPVTFTVPMMLFIGLNLKLGVYIFMLPALLVGQSAMCVIYLNAAISADVSIQN